MGGLGTSTGISIEFVLTLIVLWPPRHGLSDSCSPGLGLCVTWVVCGLRGKPVDTLKTDGQPLYEHLPLTVYASQKATDYKRPFLLHKR